MSSEHSVREMDDHSHFSALDYLSDASEGFDKLPESLQELFKDTRTLHENMLSDQLGANGKVGTGASLFTKSRAAQVNSKNAEEDKYKRAEEIFNKFKLFG